MSGLRGIGCWVVFVIHGDLVSVSAGIANTVGTTSKTLPLLRYPKYAAQPAWVSIGEHPYPDTEITLKGVSISVR